MPAKSGIEIASINVNGVRAAFRNGMGDWLKTSNSHILALQEVRASYQDLAEQFEANGGLAESGGKWHILHDEASAKGRAGVALVSTIPFVSSSVKLGATEFDSAGRWLEGTYQVGSKKLTVVSTYVHAGEADTPKQIEKYKFLDAMQSRMAKLQKSEDYAVVVGDLNVGHTELDIKNWKGNLKNAGFLPEERAYFDTLLDKDGWVDVGRAAHPDVPGPYTWWSFRGQAFDTDTGWRIDYHLASPKLAAGAKNYTATILQ
ncbi:MAG: exodeoxyribonuclease III [Micrococcales bacterium]|nr:exodeoxyribonuclease III [Micrococcales bacterium]